MEYSKPNFLTLGLAKLFSIDETLVIETLKNDDETSRENECSVILYANFDIGIDINISQNLQFIQIPHYGSRRNISHKILNQIIGAI